MEYPVRPPYFGSRQNWKSLIGNELPAERDRHTMAAGAWLLPISGWDLLVQTGLLSAAKAGQPIMVQRINDSWEERELG